MNARRAALALCLPLALAAAARAADNAADKPGDEPPRRAHPADPFERWNRGVFEFNEALDRAVLEPVATGYRNVVPQPLRTAVGNFFGNFNDAWSAVNHFLQGKPASGLQMTMRVGTNTVIGLGGLLDVATEAGLERHSEDFGQTLGVWGLRSGPYLVWPLLGPSALRETAAMPLDRGWSPALAFHDDGVAAPLLGLEVVDTRARLLGASRLLGDIAFDKYSFTRDAYLARRQSLVYDGDPPEDADDRDEGDAGDSADPAAVEPAREGAAQPVAPAPR